MEQQDYTAQQENGRVQESGRIPEHRLPITSMLIVANIAMYGLTTLFGMQSMMLFNRLRLVPMTLGLDNLWTLVTSMFLHADLGHLLANMYSLYVLGRICEPMLGRRDYLIAYFGGGIAGSLLFVLLRHGEAAAAVGASGAIFSLLGFYGAFLLNAKRRTKDGTDSQHQVVESAWQNFIIVLLINIAIVPMQGNIAWEGHLGGFVFGALFGSRVLGRGGAVPNQ